MGKRKEKMKVIGEKRERGQRKRKNDEAITKDRMS